MGKTQAQGQECERAIVVVAAYHNKGAFTALLRQFTKYDARTKDPDKEKAVRARVLREWTEVRMSECLPRMSDLGLFPDPLAAEWEDWWARAEPLLTEDMKLKTEIVAPVLRTWRAEPFAKTTEGVSLSAAVDTKVYRVGDPIRLDLTLANHGQDPCSVVRLRLPSGWMPTMGYGIKLKRQDAVLIDLAPSKDYEGSYSGPPAFETLAPDVEFRSSICLQYWTGSLLTLPLPEGDYELTIIFDSAQFAGIAPQGVQLVHRWEAPVVKFTIKGAVLRDPKEILALIADKTQQKFLINGLISPQLNRHDRAWRAIAEYGDSRLAPFLKNFAQEHSDKVSRFLKSVNLRPFEREARKGLRP